MTSEVVRWADRAQYHSERMVPNQPKVTLLSMTPDPLGSIAASSKVYKGEIVGSLSDVTDAERESFFQDGTKTVLGAPFETVDFHFLIEGVTRAFTHQLVRQRTAVYFQESMRFAVLDDRFEDRVTLPPSLSGTVPWDEFVADMDEQGLKVWDNATEKQRQRKVWDDAVKAQEEAYKSLVNNNMPAEDARGLLPTNIMTRVQYKTNLRNLIDHAGMRLCTQAQFEWRQVFEQITNAIRTATVTLPVDSGVAFNQDGNQNPGVQPTRFPVHMADRIADKLFKPVCFKLGKCGFKASYDRECSIRKKVDVFEANSVPSDQWTDETKWDHLAIRDSEWMLNPAAARS